ncbi:RNA recognition motif (RRM, RBD, or RNP domain) [Novymonas esmeraldas]|uniref:RNA recognition motif (RRM, RBD, or RNP domain) n=1 Tax=Novymonas esmeraldas TaxID=1808958 RepID=A0AAW0EQP5_9TRYP
MNKLFLRNVPLDVSEAQLVERLCVYGSVVSVTLHNDTTPVTDPALRRRIAFITFSEAGAAEAALRGVHNTCAFHQCHGIPLMGKLSEDYSQKTRTPRTPRTPHAVMTPHSSRRGVPRSPNTPLCGASGQSDTSRSFNGSISVGGVVVASTPLLNTSTGSYEAVNSPDAVTTGVPLLLRTHESRDGGAAVEDATAAQSSRVARRSDVYRHNPYDI